MGTLNHTHLLIRLINYTPLSRVNIPELSYTQECRCMSGRPDLLEKVLVAFALANGRP